MRFLSFTLSSLLGLSCSTPANYINQIPEPSLLKEKDDMNLKIASGADNTLADGVYDFDLALATSSHIGFKTHLTTAIYGAYYHRLRYNDFAVVYFDRNRDKWDYEVQLGIGSGYLRGGDEDYIPDPDRPGGGTSTPFGIKYKEEYVNKNQFVNAYLQSCVFLKVPNDDNLEASLGLRVQSVNYFEYFHYGMQRRDSPFSVWTVDPFLGMRYDLGTYSLGYTVGYSFNSDRVIAEHAYPVHYRRFFVSVRLTLQLAK